MQIWFTGGGRRDYIILHRQARWNRYAKTLRSGLWRSRALAHAAPALGSLDLRDRNHAARLEAALTALDLTKLTE